MKPTTNNQQPTTKSGFTFIELLVGMVVLIILVGVGGRLFFQIIRTESRSRNSTEVKQVGANALQVMSIMIRNAEEVSGSSATSLSILNNDGDTTTFICEDLVPPLFDRIASQSGVGTVYLTGSAINATCDNFFTYTPGSAAKPGFVEINFTLTKEEASENFINTVSLRDY